MNLWAELKMRTHFHGSSHFIWEEPQTAITDSAEILFATKPDEEKKDTEPDMMLKCKCSPRSGS